MFGEFHIKCIGYDADGILYRYTGRHFYLPFAGFTIGRHAIGCKGFDLRKERSADGLRHFVVFALEAVGARNATALRIEHRELHTRNEFKQFGAIHHPSHALHVAGTVVSHMLFIVGAEGEFNLSFIEQLEKEAGGENSFALHQTTAQAQS